MPVSLVLEVPDKPYFDYNLASLGRPNRFILSEREGGRRLFCSPIISP